MRYLLTTTILAGLLLLAACPATDSGNGNTVPATTSGADDAADTGDDSTANAAPGGDESAPDMPEPEISFGPNEVEWTAEGFNPAESEFAPEQVYTGTQGSIAQLRPELSEVYTVEFNTSFGPFTMEVYPELSPIHGVRFLELVRDGYYDDLHIHRIAPEWVVQWGDINDSAATQAAYEEFITGLQDDGMTNEEIGAGMQDGSLEFEPVVYDKYADRADMAIDLKDDTVNFPATQWTVCFAKGGPDTSTTQPFINLGDNSQLTTAQGGNFACFAQVTNGQKNVEQLVAEFTPAMESAKADLRAELEQIVEEQNMKQMYMDQNGMTEEQASQMIQQQIEQQLQNDLAWGEFVDDYWDPFEQAMINSAEIIERP